MFQAGGQEATDGNDLAERMNRAAKSSAIRLYSEFDAADHDRWGKVLDEARKGNLEALKAVGHTQEADKHPVCQKLLAYIGPGKKGAEIRDNFEAPPFGWPRDAIDGALYRPAGRGPPAGHRRCRQAGRRQEPGPRPSSPRPTSSARVDHHHAAAAHQDSRSCSARVGVPCQPKEELAKVPLLLARLRELAAKAGGPAPAPEPPEARLPSKPSKRQSGNAQLLRAVTTAPTSSSALSKAWTQDGRRHRQALAGLAPADRLAANMPRNWARTPR